MPAIAALNGGARRQGEVRISLMQSGYPRGQQIKGSRHAPDGIVNFFRAVQRHDYIVQVLDDLVRIPLEQEPGAEEGGANVSLSQEPAQAKQVRMHERF